jgi:glycerol-3-phosphate dehydrogenase
VSNVTFSRPEQLAALRDTSCAPFDVLVVGGGATGAGVALDAASRGLRVALVDARDWAAGTSSRSSKLVHGGLRYLESRDFGLVLEGLRERARLLHNAPHLVRPLRFAVPLYDATPLTADRAMRYAPVEVQRRAFRIGLALYDLLGSWRLGRHKAVDASELRQLLPALTSDGLQGGFVYSDAQADDARLVLGLVRTAVLDHHTVACSYVRAIALVHDDQQRVCGVTAIDAAATDAQPFVIRASVVVNATGVWAQTLRDKTKLQNTIAPAKGIHITLRRDDLPAQCAAVLTVPEDGRHVFVIPDGDYVYVGTTDTPYVGDLDEPSIQSDEVEYLLSVVNAWSERQYTADDVTGVWSGVRPLVVPITKLDANGNPLATADLSRRHVVERDDDGLISVYGGKLTSYRAMAADTLGVVIDSLREMQAHARPADRLQLSRRSRTKRLPLRGAVGTDGLTGHDVARALGITPQVLGHLVARYGGEARVLLAMIGKDPQLAQQTHAELPYQDAEFVYAARYEMCATLCDALEHRTRAVLLNTQAARDAAPHVAKLLASELGWSQTRINAELAMFNERVDTLWSHVVA